MKERFAAAGLGRLGHGGRASRPWLRWPGPRRAAVASPGPWRSRCWDRAPYESFMAMDPGVDGAIERV